MAKDFFNFSLNTKKKIAREVLILITCILIFGLSYISIYPYNVFIESKIKPLKDSSVNISNYINLKENAVKEKVSAQKKLFEKFKKEDIKKYPTNYKKLWEHFEILAKQDSLLYKANNEWGVDITFFKRNGFNSIEEFNEFILENSFTIDEIKDIKSVDAKKIELNNIKKQIIRQDSKRFLDYEKLNFSLKCFLFSIIVAFPVRYLFYLTKWCIKIISI